MLSPLRPQSTPRTAIAAVLFVVFAGLGIAIWAGAFERETPVPVRISGGMPGGTYDALARGLAPILAAELGVSPGDVQVLESSGSDENVRRLEAGEAELAFVQNDTLGVSGVRTLAVLYEEVLHLLVRPGAGIAGLDELADRRVSLGPAGSGTEVVARRVLEHFGLQPGAPGGVREASLSAEEALAAFEDPEGDLDAAFILSAFPSPAVAQACEDGVAALLTLGDGAPGGTPADALEAVFPFYESTPIPSRTYGRHPREALNTISVTALLTSRAFLDEELARQVTGILFDNRQELAAGHHVALRFREHYDPEAVQIPFHPGAVAHYGRDQPAFVVEYAEAISLGFSMLAASISLGIALLASLQQRNKDRIDQYYRRLEDIAVRVLDRAESNESLRADLYLVRHEAFERLVAEELQANESFSIFQDYLRALLQELETRKG